MNCCLKAKDYDYKCELTSGLIKLGQSALNGGGSTSNMFADTTPMTIVIPGSIQRMGPNAIANFGKAQTVRVQLGAPGDLVGELVFDITSTQSVIHSNATSPNATKDIKYVDFYTNVYDANSKIGTGDSARYVSQMLCGPEYTLGAEGLAVTISFIKEGA